MREKIKFLKALSDETRIKILQYLIDGEKCACSFVFPIKKAQPTVSQHLKILEDAGIVESRRDGVNIWYRLKSKEAKRIMGILNIEKIESKGKRC